MAVQTFEVQSLIPTTLERMIVFHSDPAALARLTPPPIVVRVHRDDRKSLTDGEIEFTLWFGPIPVRWIARHQPGPTETSFADMQVRGPLQSWRHEHVFEAVSGGVRLTDRVAFEHAPGGLWSIFTRLAFARFNLRLLFLYRHLRTRLATRPAPAAEGASE